MNEGTATQVKAESRLKSIVTEIWRKYNFILIFAAILIAFLIINRGSVTLTTVMNIPRHSTVIGIIALGMGLIVLTGDIDLSVGSQLALVGGLTVMVFNKTNSIPAAFAAAALIGLLLGLINGFWVGVVKMPAFIATLATMLMFRSIAQTVMNQNQWTIYQLDAGLSQWKNLWTIGNASIGPVPILVIVLVVIFAVLTYITTGTKFGKQLYAIGSNEKAAKLSGINISATRVLVYTCAGLLIGIASFLYVANVGSVDPATSGKNYEMYAIAGLVIGGLSMSGGKGRILGIVFGSMSFTIIDKIINALGVNPLINDTIKGAILLLAILIQLMPSIMRHLGHKE